MTPDEAPASVRPSGWFHPPSPSRYVRIHQVELLVGHCEAPQVPAYPEEQAEEGQQRSGQDEKVPETEGCEDPDEEQDEADDVKNQSQSKEEGGALSILHGRRPLYVD